MTVKVGDALPDVTVKTWEDGVADLSIGALTEGKTAVIFGLPGAFTPTCSIRHLPGFVDHAEALMAKGVDVIAVHSVNDPHVMNAWNKQEGSEHIHTIADWNAEFAKACPNPSPKPPNAPPNISPN